MRLKVHVALFVSALLLGVFLSSTPEVLAQEQQFEYRLYIPLVRLLPPQLFYVQGDSLGFIYADGTGATTVGLTLPESQQFFRIPHSRDARLSPDAERFVVAQSENDVRKYYAIEGDSLHPTHLYTCVDGCSMPSWSPNGEKLVFYDSPTADSDINHIYVMNADGTNLQAVVTENLRNGIPRFSPDGTKVIFHAYLPADNILEQMGNLYVVDMDGLEIVQLTDSDSNDRYPVWSPDGSQIAFESDGSVKIINSDGTNLINLADNAWRPAWSPDGSQIAAVGEQELRLINIDGSDDRVLLADSNLVVNKPIWSPNGKYVAFAYTVFSATTSYVVDVETEQVTEIGGPLVLQWRP